MARPLQIKFAGALYHLTSRGARAVQLVLSRLLFDGESLPSVDRNPGC